MSKNRFLTSFFLFLTFCGLAQNQEERQQFKNNYPNVEEVLSYLNDNIYQKPEDCFFDLQKKKEGYFLVLNWTSEGKTIVEPIHIWSSETGNFLNFDKDAIGKNEEQIHSKSVSNGLESLWPNRERYDFMLFYGYPAWSQDIQDYLSGKSDLTTEEHELLARAYSEEATSYIHPKSFGVITEATKDLEESNFEKISAVRVEKFISLASKSLQHWDSIKILDPSYHPFIITDLNLKIAHDNMHYFTLLNSIQEDKLARDFLNEAFYSQSFVSYAKSLLDGCSQNAILFTSGDTDTYTLDYVQEKMGFRKDVIVLNASLMQTAWYNTMSQQKGRYATQLMKNDIENLQGVYLIPNGDEEMPLENWLTKFLNDSTYRTKNICEIPKKLYILVQSKTIEIELRESYISIAQLLLLDILTHNPKRAVFISSPNSIFELGLWSFCSPRTNSFEITNKEQFDLSDEESVVQLKKSIQAINLDYLKGLGDVSEYELNSIFYRISRFNVGDESEKMEVFNAFNERLNYKSLMQLENVFVLGGVSTIYDEIDPSLGEEFKRYYEPFAEEKVESLSAISKNLYNEVLELKEIYKIYARSELYYEVDTLVVLNEVDKKMIELIYKKAQQIKKSPIMYYRSWTKESLEELIAHLEQHDFIVDLIEQ